MVRPVRSVLVAGTGAEGLAAFFSERGARVDHIDLAAPLEPAVLQNEDPLDLCVIADDLTPSRGPLSALSRDALADSLARLTVLPFRLAVAIRPRLAASGGRLVLLTSIEARMQHGDAVGLYAERPFRAAAHALWRCLSIEWADEGIGLGLVALDPETRHDIAGLARTIAGEGPSFHPVELTDAAGQRLGW